MNLIVSFPSEAGSKKTNTTLFFPCLGGLFFWACLFFWRQAGTISWAEPGWEAGQGEEKLPAGPVESDDKGDLPFVVSFSLLGAFVFFLAGGRHAPWRRGICFFRAWAICFSGPVFFRRQAGSISWRVPGRETNNQIHVP